MANFALIFLNFYHHNNDRLQPKWPSFYFINEHKGGIYAPIQRFDVRRSVPTISLGSLEIERRSIFAFPVLLA